MMRTQSLPRCISTSIAPAIAALAVSILIGNSAFAQSCPVSALAGNLVVSRSVYTSNSAVKVGQVLPPGCTGTTGGCSAGTGAIAGSAYPQVFNNLLYDPSFGVSSKIFLDETTIFGSPIISIEVPNSGDTGVTSTSDQLVANFNSKSELGLHLSLDNNYLIMMGYVAPISTLDVANSSTPGVVDPTDPVGEKYYRAVIAVDGCGNYTVTETNAFSGGSPRSAILNNLNGKSVFYAAGSAGNGKTPQPNGVILGSGAQILTPVTVPEYQQNPSTTPSPVGSFNITELADKADTIGKDDDFRGMAVFNNVIYYSKGSGANGINTIYFLDTTGKACPNGVGLPSPTAALPTAAMTYNASTLQSTGLPNNMCILKGFPTTPNKTANPVMHPFGIWFANATTLYVADEGDGYTGGADLYTHAAAQTTAGLQKWIFNSTTQTWARAYTLQKGLQLGVQNTPSAYPTGTNTATKLPWAIAADGLRNITGLLGGNTYKQLPTGTVAIFAISSTVSGSGDPGADPNRLMYVIDNLANTTAAGAANETFYTAEYANSGEVLRGVSLSPGTTGITSH